MFFLLHKAFFFNSCINLHENLNSFKNGKTWVWTHNLRGYALLFLNYLLDYLDKNYAKFIIGIVWNHTPFSAEKIAFFWVRVMGSSLNFNNFVRGYPPRFWNLWSSGRRRSAAAAVAVADGRRRGAAVARTPTISKIRW